MMEYPMLLSRAFWNRFSTWWSDIRGINLSLSLKDIIVDIPRGNDLVNYLIILGKLCIWECKRRKSSPKFSWFMHKVKTKQENERPIAIRSKKPLDLRKR